MLKIWWSYSFSCYVLFLYLILLPKLTTQLEQGQSCLIPEDNYLKSHKLKLPHQNCTHVIGNIYLMVIEDLEGTVYEYFENIEEITGYLCIEIILPSTVGNITLPKLKIIRGESLVRINVGDPEYALLVSNRGAPNFSLELPALREISKGSVGIYTSQRMCFLETINWKQIMADKNAQFHYFPSYDKEAYLFSSGTGNKSEGECEKCHPSCLGGCWGEGEDNCQQLQKLQCSSQCHQSDLCFGPGPHECCHSSCTAGCIGPTARDCHVCKNVEIDGECRESCPTEKYTFGVSCVDSCPDGSLLDKEAKTCLAECPENKWKETGKCVNIPSHIRKCQGHRLAMKVNSETLKMIQNCNVRDGSVLIVHNNSITIQYNINTFTHNHNFTHSVPVGEVTSEDLDVFNTVRIVTGTIYFYDLNYSRLPGFTNLEEIWGSLYIFNTELESLDFPALRHIGGNVIIWGNPYLCHLDSIKWSSLTTGNNSAEIEISDNGDDCKEDGGVCSENCSENGCYGPGAEQCVCLEYRQEGRCVPSCDSGYFRDGHHCVKSCAIGKYEQSGECVYCHESCKDGCTGPEKIVGVGGCNSCFFALLENGKYTCMGSDETCPSENYVETPKLFKEDKGTEEMEKRPSVVPLPEFFLTGGTAPDHLCVIRSATTLIFWPIAVTALLVVITLTLCLVYCWKCRRPATMTDTQSVRYKALYSQSVHIIELIG